MQKHLLLTIKKIKKNGKNNIILTGERLNMNCLLFPKQITKCVNSPSGLSNHVGCRTFC